MSGWLEIQPELNPCLSLCTKGLSTLEFQLKCHSAAAILILVYEEVLFIASNTYSKYHEDMSLRK